MDLSWSATVVYIMALLGTAAGAVTGALVAGRRHMDLFGVVLLGVVTAIGGGTIRDILLGAHPVFWIRDLNYLHVAIAASLASFLWMRYGWLPVLNLNACDAIALAMFSVAGTEKARALGAPATACVLAGLLTAVFGGVIRDVLTARQPYVMKSELYATTSLAGASIYILLVEPFPKLAAWAGVGAVLFLRWGALTLGWTLPSIKLDDPKG